MWDAHQIASCAAGLGGSYEIIPLEPADIDCPADLDPIGWVESVTAAHAGRADGIMTSSDYPGAALAAAVAEVLGWKGPSPASHKHLARGIQRKAVPEATPLFHLIAADAGDDVLERLPYPLFVKPIRGAFSAHARRVDSGAALRAYLDAPTVSPLMDSYLLLFHRMSDRYLGRSAITRGFIGEEILRGDQVTVEGFVSGGRAGIIGIVDSILHPSTGSFVRFDYPSALDPKVQDRMKEIARRVVAAHGLDDMLFNIEMRHDPVTDRIGIIEINPRMCGQFADLYEKVDGINSYEIALAIATGADPPRPARRGAFACAASFPLRIFEPARVARTPDAAALADLERRFEARARALIWSECKAGEALGDFGWTEDGHSARYAVVNLGASDRASLHARFEELRRMLGYSFEAL